MVNRYFEVLYLSFARRPFALLTLFFRMCICADYFRCLSNIRHIYFVCILGISFCSLVQNFILFVICFLFRWKISVLSTFNEILFARNQYTISLKWGMAMSSIKLESIETFWSQKNHAIKIDKIHKKCWTISSLHV